MSDFPADSYFWRALYADGTHLDEHSVEGGLPFAAIDQGRCVGMMLCANYNHLGTHKLLLESGQRLVFYRVRTLTVPLVPGYPMTRVSTTTLGWQATIVEGGELRNIKVLWHFGDDGRIEVESPDGVFVVRE